VRVFPSNARAFTTNAHAFVMNACGPATAADPCATAR
jgi:hypothetical protein